MASTQMRGMGANGHVFLSTSSNDISITQLDMLGGERDCAKARPAYLVD
jgi:hypothetical protein